MNDNPAVPQHPAIPPDDPRRRLAIARPDDPALAHLGLVGDTYTILLTGDDTAGLVHPHRHARPSGRRAPLRTATTSRRCSPCSTGRWNSPSVASAWWPRLAKTVNVPGQRTACLHQRLRQASTAPVHVLTARAGRVLPRGQRARREPGPRRRPHLTRPPRRRSSQNPRHLPRNTAQNCYDPKRRPLNNRRLALRTQCHLACLTGGYPKPAASQASCHASKLVSNLCVFLCPL